MLLRKEVQQGSLKRNLGTTRIHIPLPYKITATLALSLLVLITLFLFFAQISERIHVPGYLDAEQGILNVYPSIEGILQNSAVEEGTTVNKHDLLFTVSNLQPEHKTIFTRKLKQRIANLKREYQLKKEHYLALSLLNKKKFVAASVLKNTEAELLELANKIKLEDLELLKYKLSSHQAIRAPIEGTVTNIFYKPGQTVLPSKPLLQIIPKQSKLIARLFIPPKAMNFLKKGQAISIQYDAYPPQQFGFYKAFIKEINLTVLTDDKEDKPIRIGEPYYKIKAELDKSHVLFYGIPKELNYGMTLNAILTCNRKRIWQWVFDPLRSYFGDRPL